VTARATNASQLERWLGKESCERISAGMRGWYGRPIAVSGVPGRVFVDKGGDFRGRIHGGLEVSVREVWEDVKARGLAGMRAISDPAQLNANFQSFSDFIAAYSTMNKRRQLPLTKVGATGVANVTNTLWQSVGWPPAGGAGSAAPGGRACDVTTVGAWPFRDAAGGQTLKFVAAYVAASAINNTLMLYDRIFDVAKTMSSAAAEAVNGSPTRYQSTVATDDDAAIDNFLMIEVQAALGATAHNWTPCDYTNQAGTAGKVLPSLTGNSAAIAQRLDHPVMQWFAPLAAGDTGIQKLTNMQCSAVVTGSINFVIGHPLAWIPCGATAGVMAFTDGATSAFARIFDDACLALLEFCKPTTTATTYGGTLFAAAS